MPKPMLRDDFGMMTGELIDVLLRGHHKYRPDLPYPESHSDMDGAVRELLSRFELVRRPTPIALPLKEVL